MSVARDSTTMNTFETVIITDEAAVRTITMNRPDALNAINAQMVDDLTAVFLATAEDQAVKVVVLTGAGRAFSAGADLREMGTGVEGEHDLETLVFSIIDLPQPLIAAVNGVGAGYGVTVTGLADMTFISETAAMRCPFTALGLTAELASTYTFSRRMGQQQAMWFLLSSEWMSGAQCHQAGLALEVLAPDELMRRVYEQAAKLAAMPRASLLKTKQLVMKPHRKAMKAAVRRENDGLASLAGGPANREALAAFRERREPDFTDL